MLNFHILEKLFICWTIPFGISVVEDDDAMVVVIVVVVVEMSSVELENISLIQRLSPEMQSLQESSIVGQFWKRTHSDTDMKKVNQRHPCVESHN